MKSNIYLFIITLLICLSLFLVASDCNDPLLFLIKGIAGLIIGGVAILVCNALEKRGVFTDIDETEL